MALEVLQAIELPQRLGQLLRLAIEDGRQALCLRRRLRHAVDHEGLGDRLDPVDDIVKPRHEFVDVLPVERGDEGILEPARHGAVDLVAALLERLDVGDPRVQLVIAVDHLVEGRGRGLEVVAVGDEQLEELWVPWQESEGHLGASRLTSHDGWIVMTGRSR